MERRVAVATFAFVLYLASFASRTSAACKRISYTSDACRSANLIKLDLPGDIEINKGEPWRPTYKLIKLPKDMSEIYWYCGSSRERTGLGGSANQLRITYHSSGSIHWSAYKCPRRRCEIKDTTYEWCRSSDCIYVQGKAIYKNSRDQVIKLPGVQTQVYWYCGNSRERTGFNWILANELSITYSNNGRITWIIKRCYDE